MLRALRSIRRPAHVDAFDALSFSGCAWLLTYHFGVAHALERAGLIRPTTVFLGASSGSIVAAALASGLEPRACFEQTRATARRVEGRLFGPMGRMSELVHWALDDMLPSDAHERVKGRFFASITHVPKLRNRLAPRGELATRDDLIELVLASCYIPLYYERPGTWRGRKYLDGGFTDNQPRHHGKTLTISPVRSLRAPAHVRPRRAPGLKAVLFPSDRGLCELFDLGVRDAEKYLQKTRARARTATFTSALHDEA